MQLLRSQQVDLVAPGSGSALWVRPGSPSPCSRTLEQNLDSGPVIHETDAGPPLTPLSPSHGELSVPQSPLETRVLSRVHSGLTLFTQLSAFSPRGPAHRQPRGAQRAPDWLLCLSVNVIPSSFLSLDVSDGTVGGQRDPAGPSGPAQSCGHVTEEAQRTFVEHYR